MKKNEAPEKIYIQKRSSYNNILEYDSDWTPIPLINEDNIEYTRTDAFIEKACEWLKENGYFYVNDYTGTLHEDMLTEDFKNYMKGEVER